MALTLPKLSVDQVNYLNMGLMVVSSAFAFIWPFETFLVVYAVLGPLHYLTEISWLHDKNYYTKRKYDAILLYAVGIAIWLTFRHTLDLGDNFTTVITYISFMCALAFVLFKDWPARIVSFFVILVSCNFLTGWQPFNSIFSIFLPTIIHVFLFTALFILIGALKGRSLSGILSLVVFVVCTVLFFIWRPGMPYPVSNSVKDYYFDFAELNYALMTPFRGHDLTAPDNIQAYINYVKNILYASPAAIAVMRFIAFAYMYHYLNWFSKTSVIQWHNIPRWRFAGVIVLWLAALGAYAYDYKTGLQWLFFLSFTHVLLEFPLNHVTFINIGREIKRRFSFGS